MTQESREVNDKQGEQNFNFVDYQMKRSEMIQNIASELIHEYTNFIPYDKAQELAEIVLSRIEKEGMQPPIIRILKDSYNRQEGQMGFDVNEWEEE